jgi:hypothetical protein
MKRDFTFTLFERLLEAFQVYNYQVQTFCNFIESPGSRVVILRHDVDRHPENALVTAQIEKKQGIQASYYFRIVNKSYNEAIIKEIAGMGHEIGYHYEDLVFSGGDVQRAFKSFIKNLENFRKFYPVKTVAMHGSPLSKFDNRKIWEIYDYRTCGIIGEPYNDLDFTQVLYLTDTGRKWNGTKMTVRDRVKSSFTHNIKTTFDLLEYINNGKLPERILLNVHPERWENNFLAWSRQWLFQNIKNIFKKMIVLKNERIQDRHKNRPPAVV